VAKNSLIYSFILLYLLYIWGKGLVENVIWREVG